MYPRCVLFLSSVFSNVQNLSLVSRDCSTLCDCSHCLPKSQLWRLQHGFNITSSFNYADSYWFHSAPLSSTVPFQNPLGSQVTIPVELILGSFFISTRQFPRDALKMKDDNAIDDVVLNISLRIDETIKLVMKMAERSGHQKQATDRASVMIWNRNATHRVLAEDTTFQIIFCVVCTRQAFSFMEARSLCMVTLKARCSRLLWSFSAIIINNTVPRSVIL